MKAKRGVWHRSTARVTTGQRVSLNSVESAAAETRDGQTYFAYEHLSQVTHCSSRRSDETINICRACSNWQAQPDPSRSHDVSSTTVQGSPSISSQTKETYRSALPPSHGNSMTTITMVLWASVLRRGYSRLRHD